MVKSVRTGRMAAGGMKHFLAIWPALFLVVFPVVSSFAAGIPDSIFDDLEAGYRAFREEAYDDAVKFYTKVIMDRNLPARDRAITYLLRGEAHKYNDDEEAAVDDFSRAVAIKPNYAQAFYFRGLTYETMGKYEDAYKDVRMALSFKPDNEKYQRKLALLETKLPEKLRQEISKVRAEREKALKQQAEKEAMEKAETEAAEKKEEKE